MLSLFQHDARWAKFFRRRQPKKGRTFRPALECLEDRYVPSTFTVTNDHNSGAGSLHQAIIDSNANPGGNLINFNVGFNNHIDLTTALPAITVPVEIDGTSNAGDPLVWISGDH